MQYSLSDTYFESIEDIWNFVDDFTASKAQNFYCGGIRIAR